MSLLKKREAEIQITKEQLEELEQELEHKEQKEQEQNEEIKEIKEELLTERRILKPVLFDSSSSSLSHSDPSNTPNNTPNKSSSSSSSSSSFASSTSNPFAALASNTSFGFSAYKTNPFAAMGPPISQTSPTSPKPNPFSSLNPAPNPFMSYDSSKGLDYWNKIPKPTISNQINEPTKLFAPPPPLFVQTSKESNNSNGNGNSNNENDDDNDNDETGETNNDEQGIQDNNNNNNNDDLDSTGPFSPSHNIANGESDEECILQLRTKLFRFSRNGNKTEWIEIGIGPLRILQPSTKVLTEENLEVSNESNVFKHSRLVMRRENTIRGVGTKLLLNVLLSSSVTIGRQAEKAIRFTCFSESSPSTTTTTTTTTTSSSLSTEEVGSNSTSETVITPQLVPTSYLFKTEAIEDADKLLSSLESQISRAKNSSTLSTSSTLSKTETTSSTSLNEVNNQTFESQQNNDNNNDNNNNSSTENNSLKE